jgi:tRNA threonylcarbamoyladenosine biosynthesis protein TsaE
MHFEKKYHLNELNAVAQSVLQVFPNARHIALDAPMGAGKTTLINALGAALGITSPMSSPTFSIVNEYELPTGELLFHMDWYRLRHVEDAIEAGVQEILDMPKAYCFIEWPSIASELLAPETLYLSLEVITESERIIRAQQRELSR